MTPADLEALIEQFPEIHPGNYGEEDAIALNNWGIDAVAALAQLRDSCVVSFNIGIERAAEVAKHYEPKCDTCPSGVTLAILNLKERRG